MLSYQFSRLILNSEHLLGICCDSYCAYSDTDVRVNSFKLHIDFQLFKRSDINIVPSRKRHSPSMGKSNTRLISSLLFSIFCMTTEIFHNIILHTHFLLHLYLIPLFLYYLSLIIKKSRFEKEKVSKIKKKTEEETVILWLTKKTWETSRLLPGP